jgi:hypothetical protein
MLIAADRPQCCEKVNYTLSTRSSAEISRDNLIIALRRAVRIARARSAVEIHFRFSYFRSSDPGLASASDRVFN